MFGREPPHFKYLILKFPVIDYVQEINAKSFLFRCCTNCLYCSAMRRLTEAKLRYQWTILCQVDRVVIDADNLCADVRSLDCLVLVQCEIRYTRFSCYSLKRPHVHVLAGYRIMDVDLQS